MEGLDLNRQANTLRVVPPWIKGNDYRRDIDGLRAIAVLSVLLFHAFPQWMRGGFIGVDVFFVISGYLISGIIFKELERGTFSLREFYERRVIRIFPALIVVLAAVLLFGWFSLLGLEYKQLGSYAVAGALFFANLLSWHETGYFDINAEEKPLLHLWSLGVEEQFYLFWPLALALFFRRSHKFLVLVCVVALLSFLVNVISVGKIPVAAFYSPFSRFFELMAGAAIAYFGQSQKFSNFEVEAGIKSAAFRENLMSVIGAIAIVLGLALIDSRSQFPGFWVLLPTIGTALLIQAGPLAWINRHVLSLRPLVWVGLISYPLYLWHWPLLSFARIIEGGIPSREVRFLCVLVAIFLAWATYRFVELPIRSRRYLSAAETVKPLALSQVVAMATVCVVGGALYLTGGFPERVPMLADIELAFIKTPKEIIRKDIVSACGAHLPPSARCLPATRPESEKLLIMGDSHGGALALGLHQAIQEANPSVSVVFMPKAGGCLPLRGVESYDQFGMSRNCKDKNEFVYRWAISDSSVKTVLLVGRWARRVGNATGFGAVEGKLTSGHHSYMEDGKEIRNNSEVFTHALRRTVMDLTTAGKRVIFVHQVPEFGFYPPFCGRRPIPLHDWQEKSDRCFIDRSAVENRQQEYRRLFDSVKAEFPDLLIVDPIPIFCDEKRCSLKRDSTYLYRDDDHLNHEGAYLFSKKIVAELY